MPTRQEQLLKAVSRAAELLLRRASWREALPDVLRELGEAAGVSRVYLFQAGSNADGAPTVSQRYEWTASGISPQIDNTELQSFAWSQYGLEHWYGALAERQPVVSNERDLPPAARSHFRNQDIRSLILVPIHIEGAFWGFIGFDECCRDRDWTVSEIEVLKAAVNILSSAITRHNAEEALLRSHERYQLAERASHIGTCDWDIVADKLYCSETLGPMFGFTAHSVTRTFADFIACVHPDDRDAVMASYRSSLESGKHIFCEHRIRRADHSVRWILGKGDVFHDADGKPVRMVAVLQDVTIAKETSRALEASEQRFRNLVETTSDWIWEVDSDLRYTYASPRVMDILGYEPGELIGRRPFDLMPEPEAERVSRVFADIAKGKRPIVQLENINLHKDGRHVVIETSGVPILGAGGELDGYRGVDRDISERKASVRALRYSDELFRQLADNVREIFFVKDSRSGKVLYVSPAYEKIWGDNAGHLYRDPFYFLNFIHPEDKQRVAARFRSRAQAEGFSEEFRILRPDSGVRWIWWRSFPVFSDGREVCREVCIADDITDRKEAERKRIAHETQQRAALVREVHHRVKNNLQGIIGLLRMHTAVHPELREPVEEAIAQIRAMAIVYGMQSRKSVNDIYLCEIVREIVDQAQAAYASPARILLNLKARYALKVRNEDAVPLALIINELVTNAIKHSSGDGTIRIEFQSAGGEGVVSVSNPLDKDLAEFDFRSGNGLGTGLELVNSLMPMAGADLDISVQPAAFVARFVVGRPLVEQVKGSMDLLVPGWFDSPDFDQTGKDSVNKSQEPH